MLVSGKSIVTISFEILARWLIETRWPLWVFWWPPSRVILRKIWRSDNTSVADFTFNSIPNCQWRFQQTLSWGGGGSFCLPCWLFFLLWFFLAPPLPSVLVFANLTWLSYETVTPSRWIIGSVNYLRPRLHGSRQIFARFNLDRRNSTNFWMAKAPFTRDRKNFWTAKGASLDLLFRGPKLSLLAVQKCRPLPPVSCKRKVEPCNIFLSAKFCPDGALIAFLTVFCPMSWSRVSEHENALHSVFSAWLGLFRLIQKTGVKTTSTFRKLF